VSGGGVTCAAEAEALADVAAVAEGAADGAAEALVVGAVDVGVSPPQATTRQVRRARERLRMTRSYRRRPPKSSDEPAAR